MGCNTTLKTVSGRQKMRGNMPRLYVRDEGYNKERINKYDEDRFMDSVRRRLLATSSVVRG